MTQTSPFCMLTNAPGACTISALSVAAVCISACSLHNNLFPLHLTPVHTWCIIIIITNAFELGSGCSQVCYGVLNKLGMCLSFAAGQATLVLSQLATGAESAPRCVITICDVSCISVAVGIMRAVIIQANWNKLFRSVTCNAGPCESNACGSPPEGQALRIGQQH